HDAPSDRSRHRNEHGLRRTGGDDSAALDHPARAAWAVDRKSSVGSFAAHRANDSRKAARATARARPADDAEPLDRERAGLRLAVGREANGNARAWPPLPREAAPFGPLPDGGPPGLLGHGLAPGVRNDAPPARLQPQASDHPEDHA